MATSLWQGNHFNAALQEAHSLFFLLVVSDGFKESISWPRSFSPASSRGQL